MKFVNPLVKGFVIQCLGNQKRKEELHYFEIENARTLNAWIIKEGRSVVIVCAFPARNSCEIPSWSCKS